MVVKKGRVGSKSDRKTRSEEVISRAVKAGGKISEVGSNSSKGRKGGDV